MFSQELQNSRFSLYSFSAVYICAQELESNGIGMGSVHGSRQYDVTSHCNIDRIPAIVAVVNRRVSHYYGRLQARNIRSFVKNALPSWIITEVHIQVLFLHQIEVMHRAYSCFTAPNYNTAQNICVKSVTKASF